ncbi:arylsulfatase [Cellulophaga sp. F20128]|uniref:sulfatase family protein n=1 Tax=Cellulophaga sp. F20128 TaxID=2926413 RepID=UPI001FF3E163|nr:arylsulfatase [Cellulophaga sp. F20128]MCK0156293.1 arylsulfatase [Cellulophaga sp. F20128]
MKAVNVLLVIGAFILFSACNETKKEAFTLIEKQPNIIYVLADDLGYGDIKAFNPNGKISTPYLDQLAADGIKFTDAHTSSAVCTPTRYGILTGRYNWRSRLKSGVLSGVSKALIPNSRTTVASLLKKNGYHTGFIGKWHLGWDWALNPDYSLIDKAHNPKDFENIDFSKAVTNSPNDIGFDYAYGHNGSLDMAPYVYVENGMPTSIPLKNTINKAKYTHWRGGPTSPDFVHTDVTPNFFRRSFNFIKENANKDKPFFLYLPLPSPHTPILPTEEWLGKSGLNPYADFMMQIDDFMGKLVATIEEAGIAENTIVIFTSDNGCSPQADFKILAEKGHHPSGEYRGHKADIFEGGHRVPFIVKWPAKVKAGSTSDATICTTDLLATAADIVGVTLEDNEGEDSFSFLSLLQDGAKNKYKREVTIHSSINGSFAIRKGDYKLILAPGSAGWSAPRPNAKEAKDLPEIQLYNLKEDVGETQNLQASHPEKVAELKQLLAKQITDGRSTSGAVQANDSVSNWKQIKWITASE